MIKRIRGQESGVSAFKQIQFLDQGEQGAGADMWLSGLKSQYLCLVGISHAFAAGKKIFCFWPDWLFL